MFNQRVRVRDLAKAALVVVLGVAWAGGASAGVLDRLRQTSAIRLGYREDAPPFSYKNTIGEPAGYMVDLCRAVAKQLAQQLKIPTLKIEYVAVTATNRFEAIEQDKADLLCEPTSATLSRREMVDFSIATYVDGASLMIRTGGPRNIQELAGRDVGVLGGTTTEQELRTSLKMAGVTANVHLAKTHADGLAMLDGGTISGYFADRGILTSLIGESKAPGKLGILDDYLTVEPYALALPHGDEDFRLAVDRALSHIYGSGEIGTIFAQTFPAPAKPSSILQTLYLISGLPD